MKLIIGLGNPTIKYAATRHNVGYDTITRLCDRFDISLDFRKHKALCGKGIIANEKVILMQPLTYMNLSGESVIDAINYYKLTNKDIIVIYDDCNLDIGKLRLRPKGSAGGHNGIKNIIAHLGTDEFDRVRVGIGEKPSRMDLADYVLGRFHDDEQDLIREGIDKASKACVMIIESGIEKAMNDFNNK